MTNPPGRPSEIPFDEPCTVPLNEINAAMAVLARLEKILRDPDNAVADQLFGIGTEQQGNNLPGNGLGPTDLNRLEEAPVINDHETARAYVHVLVQHLRSRKPNGAFRQPGSVE